MRYVGNAPAIQSTEFREEFFPTTNQTVFITGGFHPSAVSITRNGVLLSESDYVKGTDNVTITLNSAAISGDVVVIRGNRSLVQGVAVSESRVEHTWQSGDTAVQLNADVVPFYSDIYLNGVKLAASDYTINTVNRTVSFTSAPAVGDVIAVVHRNETSALVGLPLKDSAGNEVLSQSGNAVSIGTLRLPTSGGIQDSSGVNVLTEASGVVTLTADEANVGSNALVIGSNQRAVFGSTSDGVLIYGAGGGSANKGRIDHYPSADDNYAIAFYNAAGSFIGSVYCTSSSTAFNTGSDYRLKENITEITDGITRVKQLNPSRFNFITDPDVTVDGFIAHQVSDIVPEAVSGEKDAVNEDGSINPQGIDQSKLVPLLTAALQESIALIESQQSQILSLTERIEALEAT